MKDCEEKDDDRLGWRSWLRRQGAHLGGHYPLTGNYPSSRLAESARARISILFFSSFPFIFLLLLYSAAGKIAARNSYCSAGKEDERGISAGTKELQQRREERSRTFPRSFVPSIWVLIGGHRANYWLSSVYTERKRERETAVGPLFFL